MKISLKFWISLLLGFSLFIANAQKNIDSVKLELRKKNLNATYRMDLLNRLAAYCNQDFTNEALIYANEAYLLALKAENKKNQVKSLLILSEGFLYNDSYDQALLYAFRALDIIMKSEEKTNLAECYRMLGWIFYDSENAEFSMQYHQMANILYVRQGDKKNTGISLNAIGLVYQMKNMYDTAKLYFEKALEIARELDSKPAIAASLNNIGICENDFGNYKSATFFLNESLLTIQTLHWPLSEAETLNQLAYSKLMLREYKESRELLQRSRLLIDNSTSNTKKEKLLDNLGISSKLYKALNNYDKAFLDLQEYTSIRNQILSRAKSDAVAAFKLKRESSENETQIKTLQTQKELRSFQRNALATGIVLLVIIGLLLLSRLKHKQKKKQELFDIKQLLIRQELDNTILEKESLNSKLEYKKNELKNYALYISQRNELIRGFMEELNVLKSEGQREKSKFDSLLNKFQHDLEINRDAQDFNISVEEIHKEFFYGLLQKFPDLTEHEKKLCAQIRLNLSIKDIASLNNISIKSAEMARYRLRKHFNLAHEENLNDFLKRF